MSVQVDDYVGEQALLQRVIVQCLRSLILKTCPGVREEFKMGVPWYEGKFYIVALRDHVNLGCSVKGLSEVENRLFEGRGAFMRHLKFYVLEGVAGERVAGLLRLVAEKSGCC